MSHCPAQDMNCPFVQHIDTCARYLPVGQLIVLRLRIDCPGRVSVRLRPVLLSNAASSVTGNLNITERNCQCVLVSEKREVYHKNVFVGKNHTRSSIVHLRHPWEVLGTRSMWMRRLLWCAFSGLFRIL